MNTKQIDKVGDASYFGGTAVATIAGIVMIRKMAKSDIASAWNPLPAPWIRLARRHPVLTAVFTAASVLQVVGLVIRGPRIKVTEFPPTEELFGDEGPTRLTGPFEEHGLDGKDLFPSEHEEVGGE